MILFQVLCSLKDPLVDLRSENIYIIIFASNVFQISERADVGIKKQKQNICHIFNLLSHNKQNLL